MPDELEKASFPKELSEAEVLARFESDPCAQVLCRRFRELFARSDLKVYRKDKNLLSLIDGTSRKRIHGLPLIDKSTRLVFVVGLGKHEDVVGLLYKYFKAKQAEKMGQDISNWDFLPDLGDADNYVREGFGYFFSGAQSVLVVQGRHMVYGEQYRPDAIDKAIFATYADKGQVIE